MRAMSSLLMTGNFEKVFHVSLIFLILICNSLPFWSLKNRLMPNENNNTHLYDINGQIKNKKEFIRRFIPNGCKIHLLGHSVGGYMSLELLKDDDVSERCEVRFCCIFQHIIVLTMLFL